jgi:MutS domain V
MSDPRSEYQQRLRARQGAHAALTVQDARVSYARVAVFAAAAALAFFAARSALSAWWIAAPLMLFVALVVAHDRVIRARDAMSRAIAFYERGLARIEDRWAGGGDGGERFQDLEHPYSQDLDLFGPASLFELLSLARTSAGQETLAEWLTHPASSAEVVRRQEAVTELAPRLDLREQLSLTGATVGHTLHSRALCQWADAPPFLPGAWARVTAIALSLAMLSAIAFMVSTGNSTAFMIVALLELLFWIPLRKAIVGVLHRADSAARQLTALATVLERLETEHFESDRVAHLQAELTVHGTRASVAIRRLRWLVEFHDWQHNPFFAPFAAMVLWSNHLAYAMESWRKTFGHCVATWLRVSGEFEALASLSAYHFEHPADPFPEFVDRLDAPATFHGAGLGHPLIPAAKMVRNDICLHGATQLLVVSGSNMSGKSTMLRTVGVSAVMALAGAPVRAEKLRLTPLKIGGTLRIQDSLQEGRSRFYAEISRIRTFVDAAAAPPPLLFLLDELFHGTNSHDRVVGAAGVLRTLLDRGAIGLITTHDLAVAKVVESLAPRAANVHFEDRFEAGEILFDYRMKPGPVTHSNAVALMRAVGLEVDDRE